MRCVHLVEFWSFPSFWPWKENFEIHFTELRWKRIHKKKRERKKSFMHLAKINERLLLFALQSCMGSVSYFTMEDFLILLTLWSLAKLDIHQWNLSKIEYGIRPKLGQNKGIIWAISLRGTCLVLKLATIIIKNCIRNTLMKILK